MRCSVFTVSTPEYEIEEVVKVLRELGFDGVEWRVSDLEADRAEARSAYTYETRYWYDNHSTLDVKQIDRQAAEIKAICDDAGLAVSSLSTGLEAWQTEDLKRVMTAANAMDCKRIRVIAPWYDGSGSYVELFNKALGEAEQLEKLAAEYGVCACFETHMGNIIPSASAAYRLVSNFDPRHIGIVYDPGNMVFEGYEHYGLGIELLGEYLSHVHLKNAVWTPKEASGNLAAGWTQDWAPLDKGYADIPKLIETLKAAGYGGFVSLEDFTNNVDTPTKLANCIKFLRAMDGNER